jgi:hypothetical protein
MEFRISVTVSDHGRDEDSLDRAIDAFHTIAPDAGAVVDANTHTGALTATFTIDADGVDEVKDIASQIFADAMNTAELPLTEILDADIEAVSAAAELQAELQPA